MKNSVFINHIDELNPESTSHKVGQKKVLITNSQCESKLMQAAYGEMECGEKIPEHLHPSMEEFFLFNKGVAAFAIDGVTYNCRAGSFIKVPANVAHSISVEENISFIYWGIAL